MSNSSIYFPENIGSIDLTFSGLFDEDVLITKSQPWDLLQDENILLATYKTDNKKIAIAGAMSFEAAAGIAAFFTRFQKTVVTDAIKNKILTEELMSNVYEIMNITANIFNKETYEHITIHDLKLIKPSDIHPSLSNLLKNPAARLDTNISIHNGYGKGFLSYFKSNELLDII